MVWTNYTIFYSYVSFSVTVTLLSLINRVQVLLALASQWGEPGRREEMVQSGRQVIQIIHTKMGAGSMSASAGLPGPGVFRKLHVKLSNSYDKGETAWKYKECSWIEDFSVGFDVLGIYFIF